MDDLYGHDYSARETRIRGISILIGILPFGSIIVFTHRVD